MRHILTEEERDKFVEAVGGVAKELASVIDPVTAGKWIDNPTFLKNALLEALVPEKQIVKKTKKRNKSRRKKPRTYLPVGHPDFGNLIGAGVARRVPRYKRLDELDKDFDSY